jgi:hypothetical protein
MSHGSQKHHKVAQITQVWRETSYLIGDEMLV